MGHRNGATPPADKTEFAIAYTRALEQKVDELADRVRRQAMTNERLLALCGALVDRLCGGDGSIGALASEDALFLNAERLSLEGAEAVTFVPEGLDLIEPEKRGEHVKAARMQRSLLLRIMLKISPAAQRPAGAPRAE